ncbi:alkaline phosphatase family protein [Kaarinaea lacus]
MHTPEYENGSIVNLTNSISDACGSSKTDYAPLEELADIEKAENIIFIVIDGLGYDYLKRKGADSVFNKYLQGSLTSVFPSTTSSAITTFATAVAPQQHAITGWFTYLKELGCVTAVLPFTPRTSNYPFDDDKISMSSIFDVKPIFPQLNRDAYVVSHKHIINSSYSDMTTTGAKRIGYLGLSEFFNKITIAAKFEKGRKYIYGYWPEFDSLCHVHGVNSDYVKQHFDDLDEVFASFLQTLEGSDSVVIVTADHGLIDCNANSVIHIEKHPTIAESLSIPLCGEPRVAFCYVKPNKMQVFENYVSTKLSSQCDLYKSEDLVEARYFGLGKANTKLYDRIGDYALIMKDNYVIKDTLAGEKTFTQVGVHGGLSNEEMFVPLFVKYC